MVRLSHTSCAQAVAAALLFVFVFSGNPTVAAGPKDTPAIVADREIAVLTGVTPGARVVWLSVLRERVGWTSFVHFGEDILTDEDGDGALVWKPEGGLPSMIALVAVDLSDGAVAVLTPGDESAPGRIDGVQGTLRRSLTGHMDRVAAPGGPLLVVVARPGDSPGVWRKQAADGDPTSDDSLDEDGTVVVALPEMEPVGDSSAPPEELLEGDAVVLIYPGTLAVSTFHVPAGTAGGN